MNTLNIREARKAAKLTQDQLAEKIGINRATLSKYESGQIDPSFSQLQNIANALNIDFIELFDPTIASALKTIADNNIESADEAIRKRYGIEGNYVVVETDDDEIRKMMQAYTKLNSEGQQVAIERIEELTHIPKYQQKEKPPESLKKPNDGNK